MKKAYVEFLRTNQSEIKELEKFQFEVGPSKFTEDDSRNSLDSDVWNIQKIKDLKDFEIGDSALSEMILSDFLKVLPFYQNLISYFRNKNLFSISIVSDDGEEEKVEVPITNSTPDSNVNYWKISCGQSGRYAGLHKESNRISIGWDVQGSLAGFSSESELIKKIKTIPNFKNDINYSAEQCFTFAHEIKPGDVVFGYGRGHILLVGIVIGPYEYFQNSSDWLKSGLNSKNMMDQHTLPIKWLTTRIVPSKTFSEDIYKELTRIQTIIKLDDSVGKMILNYALALSEEIKEVENPLGLEDLARSTGLSVDFFNRIARRLLDRKQIIFAGPPGTGKTHVAQLFSQWMREGKGETMSIQFHPSYSYEDFMEGFRPSDSSSGGFVAKDGCFKEFCLKASRSPSEKFFLIIDEINRGNLAQIFGEALTLIERREEEMLLPFTKKPFSIPENVLIVGTMNTADRSIALMDFALRRRFDFIPFYPEVSALHNYLESNNCSVDPLRVSRLLVALNQIIVQKIGPQYQIGHSYFMRNNLNIEVLRDLWDFSVLPLIEEYFFDQNELKDEFEFESLWESTNTSLSKVG